MIAPLAARGGPLANSAQVSWHLLEAFPSILTLLNRLPSQPLPFQLALGKQLCLHLTLCLVGSSLYPGVPLELGYIDLKLLRTTGYTRVLHPKIPLGT